MRELTAQDMLNIWERGRYQRPVDRALILLAATHPGQPQKALAELSIGQRDAMLFALRKESFGTELDSHAECPGCGEQLEFTVSIHELLVQQELCEQSQALGFELEVDEYRIRFRLLNSMDLIAIGGMTDEEQARDCLLERCIVEATHRGEPVQQASLPKKVITPMLKRMLKFDPQAETLLDICCPSCGHQWQAQFDINEFLWIELANQAKRLLREVYTLSRAFCWSEADILSMSTTRRQSYLELLAT